jgi:hypothetical protein
MSLNQDNLTMLIDLVDNKLTSIEAFDRDDRREIMHLEHTLNALKSMLHGKETPRVPSAAARGKSRKSVTLHAF